MAPFLQVKNISKEFAGVKALTDISIDFNKGEVHALLGENGAGKSTLIKIISGVYAPTSGSVLLDGKACRFHNPRQAIDRGIVVIHQELSIANDLTVAENIYLGCEPRIQNGFFLDRKKMEADAQAILDFMEVDIRSTAVARHLTAAQQQMVEIAKAFHTNAKILIMDEPTSALTSKEIDRLFGIIKSLKEKGVGIIYISHRLEELQDIADRVTIMRDGKFIIRGEFKDMRMDEIIKNMVGREVKEKFPRISTPKGKKIFSIKNLSSGKMVRDVSFDVYEGEILGIAGLMGAGRTESTRALFGVDAKDGGTIELDGKEIFVNCPTDAIRQGVVLAPEDRKKDGLCTKLSIKENIALPNLDILCNRFGIIDRKKEAAMLENAVKRLSLKMAGGDKDAASLSGGNQQKLVVAKWLLRESRVIIFDEPTRGIDVAAKVEIYNLMNKLKQEGKGVVFVSSELPEILGIADRIVVLCEGRVTGEMPASEATQEKILYLATRFLNKKSEKEAKAV